MIEVLSDLHIVTFDGTVIEAFDKGHESRRYHVRHVKTAEVQTDKKGRWSLSIQMDPGGGIMATYLSPEAAAQAQKLVDEIQKVRATL